MKYRFTILNNDFELLKSFVFEPINAKHLENFRLRKIEEAKDEFGEDIIIRIKQCVKYKKYEYKNT